MLAWAGYTLVQNRISAGIGFLARIGMFAAFGALFSLPIASPRNVDGAIRGVQRQGGEANLFAGLVPGLFAYAAYSWFGSVFGAVSTSLSVYLGPVVGALLSIIFLGEAPGVHSPDRRRCLSLGGMWL